MTSAHPDWLLAFRAALEEHGLDVVQPFVIDTATHALFPFEMHGRDSCLGLVVANTRALWPNFKLWLRQQSEVGADPLDTFVEAALTRASTQSGVPRIRSYLSPRMDYDLHNGRRGPLPIQALAVRSGLAALSPIHLNVHPTFGPWLSLRAVLSVNAAPNLRQPEPAVEPCESCAKPCLAPFAQAMKAIGPDSKAKSVKQDWRRWLSVRQTCPVGEAHAFGDAQSEYHYLHARSLLEKIRSSND